MFIVLPPWEGRLVAVLNIDVVLTKEFAVVSSQNLIFFFGFVNVDDDDEVDRNEEVGVCAGNGRW